jgi:hypothetical protein
MKVEEVYLTVVRDSLYLVLHIHGRDGAIVLLAHEQKRRLDILVDAQTTFVSSGGADSLALCESKRSILVRMK